MWEQPPVPVPVPTWFPAFAEAVAGMRVTDRGNVELVARHELHDFAGRFSSGDRAEFYERLARWFFADPSQRMASPF
jgi:hypothetical protein